MTTNKKTTYIYEDQVHGLIFESTKESVEVLGQKYKLIGTREFDLTEPTPEPKKREPIERFVNVFEKAQSTFMTKANADENYEERDRLECVRLVECPTGSQVVSHDDVIKALKHSYTVSMMYEIADLLGIEKAGE